jgi:hypothetical protein
MKVCKRRCSSFVFSLNSKFTLTASVPAWVSVFSRAILNAFAWRKRFVAAHFFFQGSRSSFRALAAIIYDIRFLKGPLTENTPLFCSSVSVPRPLAAFSVVQSPLQQLTLRSSLSLIITRQ